MHRADTGGDAAAKQTDFIQRGLRVNFRQRDFSYNGVFAEGAGAHVVINRLAIVGEARGAIRHQAFTLGSANGLAQVSFAGFTELTLATLGGVQRDHMIARLQAGNALAHFNNDAAAFVTEYRREYAFRVIP